MSGASLVLYGTPISPVRDYFGISVLNPGTAGGTSPTFAVAEIDERGGITCRIMEL
jgi:hypothetical protein